MYTEYFLVIIDITMILLLSFALAEVFTTLDKLR